MADDRVGGASFGADAAAPAGADDADVDLFQDDLSGSFWSLCGYGAWMDQAGRMRILAEGGTSHKYQKLVCSTPCLEQRMDQITPDKAERARLHVKPN